MMFLVCNFFFEQAGTENQKAQKSTCDFEGLMVGNWGYHKGNITGGCKKFDIWRGLNSYPWYLVVYTWFQKIWKIHLLGDIYIYYVEQFVKKRISTWIVVGAIVYFWSATCNYWCADFYFLFCFKFCMHIDDCILYLFIFKSYFLCSCLDATVIGNT